MLLLHHILLSSHKILNCFGPVLSGSSIRCSITQRGQRGLNVAAQAIDQSSNLHCGFITASQLTDMLYYCVLMMFPHRPTSRETPPRHNAVKHHSFKNQSQIINIIIRLISSLDFLRHIACLWDEVAAGEQQTQVSTLHFQTCLLTKIWQQNKQTQHV